MTELLKEQRKKRIFTAMAQHHGSPNVNPRLTREKLTKPAGFDAFLQNYTPVVVLTVHGFVRLSR